MIEIQNLTYAYERADDKVGALVLNGINMQVNDGEFVAVLGRNGSGKSTLLKNIYRLYKKQQNLSTLYR